MPRRSLLFRSSAHILMAGQVLGQARRSSELANELVAICHTLTKVSADTYDRLVFRVLLWARLTHSQWRKGGHRVVETYTSLPETSPVFARASGGKQWISPEALQADSTARLCEQLSHSCWAGFVGRRLRSIGQSYCQSLRTTPIARRTFSYRATRLWLGLQKSNGRVRRLESWDETGRK